MRCISSVWLVRVLMGWVAGNVGGVANGACQLLLLAIQLDRGLGVDMGSDAGWPYTPLWLYNKVVWGGLWGAALFPWITVPAVLPLRALCFGCLVSTVHVLVFFPLKGHGLFASHYGKATFIIVYVTDFTWALAGVYLHRHLLASVVRGDRQALEAPLRHDSDYTSIEVDGHARVHDTGGTYSTKGHAKGHAKGHGADTAGGYQSTAPVHSLGTGEPMWNPAALE